VGDAECNFKDSVCSSSNPCPPCIHRWTVHLGHVAQRPALIEPPRGSKFLRLQTPPPQPSQGTYRTFCTTLYQHSPPRPALSPPFGPPFVRLPAALYRNCSALHRSFERRTTKTHCVLPVPRLKALLCPFVYPSHSLPSATPPSPQSSPVVPLACPKNKHVCLE
jgi:hypothetical protein